MENENNFLRDFGEEGGMHAPPRAPRDAISDTKKLREDSVAIATSTEKIKTLAPSSIANNILPNELNQWEEYLKVFKILLIKIKEVAKAAGDDDPLQELKSILEKSASSLPSSPSSSP